MDNREAEADRRAAAEALAALSPRLAPDTPMLALGGPRAARPDQIMFASAAMLALFGAQTTAELAALIGRAADSTAPLRRLIADLPLDGPARIERIQLAAGAATLLARRLGAPPLFVAAALDRVPAPEAPEPPVFAPDATAAGARRFLWRSDASHAIASVDRGLSDCAGAAFAVGLPLAAALARLDPGQAGRIVASLDARMSFSIDAPPGSGARLTLAGAPAFDAARRFLGYRGFALLRAAAPPPPAATAPAALAPAAFAPAPIANAALAADDRALFDALPLGIIICRDGAPAFVNRALLNLLGFADVRSAAAAGALAPLLQPQPGGEAAVELRRDGKPAFLQLRRERIIRDGAAFDLVAVQLRPAASRPGVEAELRQRQREARELRAILDTATDGVAVLDGQGRIVSLNRSAEALFGHDSRDLAGQPFSVLVAPDSQACATAYFGGLRSDGVESLLNDGREIVGLTRRGGAIPLFMTLGRIGQASGEEARYCALLRDMTHWKTVERDLDEARREAERASALKSDFLAKVSHEIRTPLSAILGFAEVIIEERFGPIGNARYKDYLKDIHNSGALVLSLVNDLLDLSKIEAGKLELSLEPVDANRIASECVSIMQPQASAAGVVMNLSLAPQLPQIRADERALRQIILNLLSNAIRFTQAGGQVIISTALTDANHAALRIRDTGVGMSAKDIETALQPFGQVASHGTGGTGLGLPLTKALVEASRAAFSIRSAVDEGTLVEVVFPPARVIASRA